MARRPKAPPVPATREEKIAEAIRQFHDFSYLADNKLISAPQRTYTVGQEVRVGGLAKTVILEPMFDDKAYLCESWSDKGVQQFNVWWWFDIDAKRAHGESIFDPYRRGRLTHSGLDSILHLYAWDGLVCDPEFQRGYVWTHEDQQALLQSIFERLEIGSVTMIRHHGYLHSKVTTPVRYMNLHGEEVWIPRCNDNTVSIIDGQQRLTTIVNFVLDRLTYRGLKFSELSYADQTEFNNTQVGYRLINEEDISRVEILKLFLQANRGVPQTAKHLAKVQALYEQEKARAVS